jgi:LPXTG-motif cell wall-anchored protein
VLPLQVEYKDSNNKDYTEQIKIPLKLYSSAEAKKYGVNQGSSKVGILIILLIVGIGLFFYIRKRRKRNK